MTPSNDRTPSPPSPPSSPARGRLVADGVVAAALGLGAVTVAVLLLWITSPYPESGPSAALHVAAALWLLAHGAELVRTDTLSGGAAPVGITPLLLSALPLWLLYRASRHAIEAHEEELADAGHEPGGPLAAGPTIGWLSAGYLLVGVSAVVYASGGPLHADALSALLHLPVVTLAAVAYGYWTASGRPREKLPEQAGQLLERVPPRVRAVLTRRRLVTAGRAGAAGTAVLLGGGALLFALSLTWHCVVAQQSFHQLTQPWTGRFAVLLLALVLVPNAVVWGAAYGTGAGFTLGAGTLVGPLGTSAHPDLPRFPLLAAVPDAGPGSPLTWPVVLLPLAAGVTVGWYTARAAVPGAAMRAAAARAELPAVRPPLRQRLALRRLLILGWRRLRGGVGAAAGDGSNGASAPAGAVRRRAAVTGKGVRGWRDTALTAALGSAACALATAVLSGVTEGALGTGALEDFGPSWWLTGAVALCWTVPVAAPTALVLRWWRRRLPHPAPKETRSAAAAAAAS
ncbi:DUF6350 family protein [Streptomyces sp. NPDC051776]|uniref:cell division protein PerM n=1 Tax=Streptomyces sp. NPDC051776 TaxID=3155414 RepID=UPI0034453AF2